jgi:hypothetical protein
MDTLIIYCIPNDPNPSHTHKKRQKSDDHVSNGSNCAPQNVPMKDTFCYNFTKVSIPESWSQEDEPLIWSGLSD